ncbi:hypothetical protein T459_14507 [Capsicum annuum]|uniref:Reticulon domain-containing protein n=1 Tax=Capsicum annuum TaxID=4072 RepID=A0A2G2ZHN2_CAPAN|nr:hypothetical protein T459_14507 [Capsicum annuum]
MNILLLFLLLKLSFLVQCSHNNSLTKSLEVILHEHAFKSLVHQHTGSLYNASVPSSLAGMKLSLVRLRSRTLWEKGANFSGFSIPPRTIPVPYVKRINILYNDLGNLFSHYFNISEVLKFFGIFASGKDLKRLFIVISSLWFLSILGNCWNFFTLFYICFVLLHTAPVLYEKYEDQVDAFAEKAEAEIKKIGGSVLGGLIGAGLTQVFGVTKDRFDNLAFLIVLCNLSSLLPLPLLGLLPGDEPDTKESIDSEMKSNKILAFCAQRIFNIFVVIRI